MVFLFFGVLLFFRETFSSWYANQKWCTTTTATPPSKANKYGGRKKKRREIAFLYLFLLFALASHHRITRVTLPIAHSLREKRNRNRIILILFFFFSLSLSFAFFPFPSTFHMVGTPYRCASKEDIYLYFMHAVCVPHVLSLIFRGRVTGRSDS